jgi:hypothetical protein
LGQSKGQLWLSLGVGGIAEELESVEWFCIVIFLHPDSEKK